METIFSRFLNLTPVGYLLFLMGLVVVLTAVFGRKRPSIRSMAIGEMCEAGRWLVRRGLKLGPDASVDVWTLRHPYVWQYNDNVRASDIAVVADGTAVNGDQLATIFAEANFSDYRAVICVGVGEPRNENAAQRRGALLQLLTWGWSSHHGPEHFNHGPEHFVLSLGAPKANRWDARPHWRQIVVLGIWHERVGPLPNEEDLTRRLATLLGQTDSWLNPDHFTRFQLSRLGLRPFHQI